MDTGRACRGICFGLWLSILVLGIYTSLPHSRHTKSYPKRHVGVTALLGVIFIFQLGVIPSLYANPFSYIRWLLFLAIVPAPFYLLRKGEHIDKKRLVLTALLVSGITVLVDFIFVPAGAWRYGAHTLLFPESSLFVTEDILFAIFNAIIIVGFYTSLPKKYVFTGAWK